MDEIWKDIKGYEGLYQVSNYGRVKSFHYNKERILKPRNLRGYHRICVSKDGIMNWFLVHRLVASAFITNPDNLPEVNHKDEDKTNNNVENLEWCDRLYNCNYGTRNKRISSTHKKRPLCV